MQKCLLTVACCLATIGLVYAQDNTGAKPTQTATAAPSSKWYDRLSLRGYAQLRYNRLLETNPDLKCDQCDRSIGKGQGLSFRRARLIFSGNVHDRVFAYIQFDYSADASSTNKHFLQVRDAYFDYALDARKEYRLRFGQSKTPFGFENLQSSQNRLPLDRSDALNSGVPNERDLGLYFMFAPAKVRDTYKSLIDQGLKGSGDYGVFAIGLYNGQGTNKPELNNNLHAVARLSYPFKIGRQIIEPGVYAYTGKYTLAKDQLTSGVKTNSDLTYLDERVGASLALYARPFGVLAEYNRGKSPSFNSRTDSIDTGTLKGGFVTLFYKTNIKKIGFQPYVRYQKYEGAKKLETDARFHTVDETELGLEFLLNPNVELTLAYTISDRTYLGYKTQYAEKGRFMRIQMQFNY